MGYRNLGHYAGGIEEWQAHGEPVESGPAVVAVRPARQMARLRPRSIRPMAWIERLAERSYGVLIGIWLGMVLGLGTLYWLLTPSILGGLLEAGEPISFDLHGLVTAIYFSFVTATSIGFGDVVPVGVVRALAVLEGATGLLIFGCIVSKLVSRRQDELAEDTHRITFEERLGRVRTNLHLVLSDLQAIAGDVRSEGLAWREGGSVEASEGAALAGARDAACESIISQLESTAIVFAGELRTVHDLLYRPQSQPEEIVIEGILANLAINLEEMRRLFTALPQARRRSAFLDSTVRAIAARAGEICGDCVPREYAPELKVWMNRIQDNARGLTAQG